MSDTDDIPTYTIYACASCGNHIDGDEVKVRTKEGWMPYHPACAPVLEQFEGFLIGGGTGPGK
jgi:hypothetical protein